MKQSKFLCKYHWGQEIEKEIAYQNLSMCLLPNFYQYPDIYSNIYHLLLLLNGINFAKFYTVMKPIYYYIF